MAKVNVYSVVFSGLSKFTCRECSTSTVFSPNDDTYAILYNLPKRSVLINFAGEELHRCGTEKVWVCWECQLVVPLIGVKLFKRVGRRREASIACCEHCRQPMRQRRAQPHEI